MPFYNKEKSLIRLEIEFANEYIETWYSALNDDKQGQQKSIQSLKRRILEKRHKGNYLNAVFYDNQTNRIIEGKTRRFSKEESIYKLIVYTLKGKKLVFYSIVGEKNEEQVIKDHLPDQYQTALLYTNPNAGYNGELISKYIRGNKIL